MLFHTAEFLVAFLPAVLLAYFLVGRASLRGAFAVLALASLLFYAWWSVKFVGLVLASIVFNYAGADVVRRLRERDRMRAARVCAAVVIGVDLAVLAYFKYLGFFVREANEQFGLRFDVGEIVLPIGISFYTFTQIAYVVDTLKGIARERSFLAYLLFVTYFPHLVAGPVLHHAEMMPQFRDPDALRPRGESIAKGLTFLVAGLFKKVVLADGCAPIANAAFGAAAKGVTTADAWLGAIAYTLQIYYDFSGYSDMAVGISLMFNIRLPVNFHSPYQARNIIDFWRCWHMTLSRFLRDYLYVPLGGNRKGPYRQFANLLVTMLLGGLWHGANWTFVVWGGLHGLYIALNHAWRALRRREGPSGGVATMASWLLTLFAVVVAWVFFRAATLGEAMSMLQSMAGLSPGSAQSLGLAKPYDLAFLAGLAALALFAPNTNQLLDYRFGIGRGVPDRRPLYAWRPSIPNAMAVGAIAFITMMIGIAGRARLEFLYFQF